MLFGFFSLALFSDSGPKITWSLSTGFVWFLLKEIIQNVQILFFLPWGGGRNKVMFNGVSRECYTFLRYFFDLAYEHVCNGG